MRDMLIHPSAVAETDVADDDPLRMRMRLAIPGYHGEARADRALVAVEPAGEVGTRVGDRIPRHPAGSLDGKLRAVDQPAGVLEADRRGVMPLDAHGFRRGSIRRPGGLRLGKPK